jgi:hypothetical protein
MLRRVVDEQVGAHYILPAGNRIDLSHDVLNKFALLGFSCKQFLDFHALHLISM